MLLKYKNFNTNILSVDNTKGGEYQHNNYEYLARQNPTKLEPKEKTMTSTATEVSEGSVPEGYKLKLGDVTLTVSDPFGIRHFKGREGQHSTGIDLTTSNGKAVALQDGVIESIKLDGDGSKIKPEQGSTAGWYATVKHSDGTKMQYMHLDPMTKEQMKSLEGKQIKKGESIWGYSQGSGSMTGKHYKVRLYNGVNPLKSYIDPSILLIK